VAVPSCGEQPPNGHVVRHQDDLVHNHGMLLGEDSRKAVTNLLDAVSDFATFRYFAGRSFRVN